MAINPVETALSLLPDKPAQRSSVSEPSSRQSFAEVMSAAADIQQQGLARTSGAAANAAIELMQLEMMKNALSLGNTESSASPASFISPAKLILANLVEGSQQVDSATTQHLPSQGPPISQETFSSSSPTDLDGIINQASRRHGVDVSLIKAVIKAESNFNPTAVSHAGAQGLMQLMPGTARDLGVTNSFDPEQNVMAGTRFLKDMLKRYHGNVDSALAAYNWGPGNVDKKGTSGLPQETRNYLARVKGYYSQYQG